MENDLRKKNAGQAIKVRVFPKTGNPGRITCRDF
jgi:hypothetical protein